MDVSGVDQLFENVATTPVQVFFLPIALAGIENRRIWRRVERQCPY